jgi:hypothetical protein
MGAGVLRGLQNRCGFEKGPGGFDSHTFPLSIIITSPRRGCDVMITHGAGVGRDTRVFCCMRVAAARAPL